MSNTVFEYVVSLIEEAKRPRRTRVIRGGHLVTKFKCPPGYKYVAGPKGAVGGCMLMSVSEKRQRKIAAKKAKKTKRISMSGSKGTHAKRKTMKSLRLRKRFGGRVGEY